jgi:hypothetical protein
MSRPRPRTWREFVGLRAREGTPHHDAPSRRRDTLSELAELRGQPSAGRGPARGRAATPRPAGRGCGAHVPVAKSVAGRYRNRGRPDRPRAGRVPGVRWGGEPVRPGQGRRRPQLRDPDHPRGGQAPFSVATRGASARRAGSRRCSPCSRSRTRHELAPATSIRSRLLASSGLDVEDVNDALASTGLLHPHSLDAPQARSVSPVEELLIDDQLTSTRPTRPGSSCGRQRGR